jgi:hypothetical protein
MKKVVYLLSVMLLLITVSFANAKNETGQNSSGGQGSQQGQQQGGQQGNMYQGIEQNQGQNQQNQNSGQYGASSTGAGNQLQNQNQINTQNQGDTSQIQVQNRERESTGQGEGLQQRNQNAYQHMSQVAQKVQMMLQIRTTGGIGDQVREVAREQNQAQVEIQSQLDKLDTKGRFARFLTGTDYKAVNNLKNQIEENQIRIEQLTSLKNQLVNQSDIIMVEETIQALNTENTTLLERVTSEEQTKSAFGWLFRLFAK